MPARFRRGVALTALALVTALALAGCGDADPVADASLTSAERTPVDAQTDATPDAPGDTTVPASTTSDAASVIEAAAVASTEQPTMKVYSRIALDDETMSESTMLCTADGSAGVGSVTVPGLGAMPALYVDGALYYGFPNLPPGKQWVRLDVAELQRLTGVDMGASAQQDPTQAFALLQSVSDDVATVGPEDVAGVATTHYVFTVRIDDMLAVQIERGILTEEAASLLSQYNDQADIDVWIGEDGLVRRMAYDLDIATGVGAASVQTVSYEFEFSEYGEPVDVTTPAPEVTLSMSDMLAQRD